MKKCKNCNEDIIWKDLFIGTFLSYRYRCKKCNAAHKVKGFARLFVVVPIFLTMMYQGEFIIKIILLLLGLLLGIGFITTQSKYYEIEE